MKRLFFLATTLVVFLLFASLSACSQQDEVSFDELEDLSQFAENELLSKMTRKIGKRDFAIGKPGGTWTSSINNDPKSFNTLTARDGDTGTIVGALFEYLVDYNPYTKEFEPNLASFEIESDQAKDFLKVTYTLRDELYWSLPGQSKEQAVKVTSDDVVFWYNEVEGDQSLQQPGYSGRFIEMDDGSQAEIRIEKIDERRFSFIFPRIVANPILSTNSEFGPRYIYHAAKYPSDKKKKGGAVAMLDLLAIDSDPRTIPSIGQFHIVEYSPGVRVVLQRNPLNWRFDESGQKLPYLDQLIYRIVPDRNTEFLVFKEGKKDNYILRPEDVSELVSAKNTDYTVYNGGRSLGSSMIAFNQNPSNMNKLVYSWLSLTKFRQALSSLLNRERIAQQVYRGLAVPAHHFFALANPMFDKDISLPYTYNPERALALLTEEGFARDEQGVLHDRKGNAVVINIQVGSENNIGVDMMNIFADELKAIGIDARVRSIDFQKLVEMLTNTYDWEIATVSLGVNYWPESGSNVWQSKGNFHLWYPLQKKPATDWEARLDTLYNQGRFTLDTAKRKKVYDEFQKLILEQVPITYIVHPLSFMAVRDKWDNVFYDNLDGLDIKNVFLKP